MTASVAPFSVGIVHYRALDDLARCLDSLAQQTRRPRHVRVYDVIEPKSGSTDEPADVERDEAARRAELARAHPDVEWLCGSNIGFAAAANVLLAADRARSDPAALQLILNADIVLDADHLEQLARVFDAQPGVAIAGGKLVRPGRTLVDSAGIRLPAHARPRDRGSETPDDGRFDTEEDVFGVSGAAMALRTSALGRLSLDGEVFDERFFMYHEDTDLCWRAARFGLRVRYVPAAVAVHERGWRKEARFATPVWIRRHSFKNHYLQLVKNETGVGLLRRLPALLAWEGLRLGFAVLRDPAILPAYAQAAAALPDAWRKRRLVAAGVREVSAS